MVSMSDNIAEKMSEAMREVSVAEFFEKNRHLLGYENPTKALITVVKELLDNSLDAANEADMLPKIKINIVPISEEKFKVTVSDNGPGIREDKVPYAFGKLLYGSKFYRLRQSRGIQGLGGHGAVLYSQLTTGNAAKVTTSIGKKIHYFELMIDVEKNEPQVIKHEISENPDDWHGVKVELVLEGRYVEGKQSIAEYVKQTHMANPYSQITFDGPNGKAVYKRLVNKMPRQPKEIKPHPYGVELGIFRRMMNATKARTVVGFLTEDFSRVGKRSANQILKIAKINPKMKPQELSYEESERIHKAIQGVKLIAPPTDCLSPLGEKLLEEGLKKDTGAEFVVAVTRPPSVYRGNPFLVEVAVGYGGALPTDQSAQLFRFANKVPLLYHQSDCVTAEGTKEVDFRRYGFSQPSSSLPAGPLAILIHFASVWVPFTSEGKQAIANYSEILKEIKLALQDAGRKLGAYVNQKFKQKEIQLRKELFEKYMPELAESLSKLTGKQKDKIIQELKKIIIEKDAKREGKAEENEKDEPAEKDVKNEEKSEGTEKGELNEEDVGREEKSEEPGQ
jgi:DNA topoisomerase-6 subunit B